MMRVYKIIYDVLTKRGIKPTFHVMDNEASSTVMSWIKRTMWTLRKCPRTITE